MERAHLGARASCGVVVLGEPQWASAMIRQDLSTSYQEVRTGRARRAGRGTAAPAQVDEWHSVACGLCSRWSRCVVPARGDDKGSWRLAVGKTRGQPLLGGSLSPPRPHDPCSPLSVARASGFPSQSRAGSGPLLLLSCGAAPALACLGVFSRCRILSRQPPLSRFARGRAAVPYR